MRDTGQRVIGGSGGHSQGAILRLFEDGGALERCKSAIVYCNFKNEADLLAGYLMNGNVTAKA